MQRSRKTILIAAGLTVFAIAGAALLYFGYPRNEVAGVSPAPELLSLVPSGAPTLIYIDLAAVRESPFYQQRPDRGPITIPSRDYAKFIQATGFDFEKDLDRVAIASWPQSLSPSTARNKTVVVAEGRFDRQKIRDYAMRNGKLDRQQGHDVFLFPAQNPDGWNALVFLTDYRLAIIEGASIAPVMTPHSKDRAQDPANDPVRDRIARVAGAAVFAVTRVPAVADNFAPGGMQSAQLVSMIRSVQWITLAARPQGDNMRISLEGECKTDTDARQLQSALEVLRLFGQAGLENPKTRQQMDPAAYTIMKAVLKTADITQSAERVRILVELTPDTLRFDGSPKTH